MDLREMQAEFGRVTEEKLTIGALVETLLSEEDGLTLRNGRTSKLKKIVIVGVDLVARLCYGSIFVNSDMNPRAGYSDEFLEAQYLIKREDYPNFLRYNSYVDCAKVFSIPLEKLLAGKYFGALTQEDREGIFEILETTDTISTKQKKRFNIRRR